ncbi:hypothetical protein, partial [Paraburkholderia fungorum]|uniref:hypothetical protein n=1 Tax=Paraburkholderia fungorum TaxID=134537 RepID=UPI001ABF1AE5
EAKDVEFPDPATMGAAESANSAQSGYQVNSIAPSRSNLLLYRWNMVNASLAWSCRGDGSSATASPHSGDYKWITAKR